VDDDPVIRRLVRAALGAGHELSEAASVREARAVFKEESPALVLLDIFLPDGEGIELIEGFTRGDAKAAVVMLTSSEDIETARRAIERGAAEYLTKPFDPEDLRRAVRRWLREPGERPQERKPWRRAQ